MEGGKGNEGVSLQAKGVLTAKIRWRVNERSLNHATKKRKNGTKKTSKTTDINDDLADTDHGNNDNNEKKKTDRKVVGGGGRVDVQTMMFSGECKRFTTEKENLPSIVIETFVDGKDNIVKAPIKDRNGNKYKIEEYIGTTGGTNMKSSILCGTTDCYFYSFSDANLRSHFVEKEIQLENYKKKVTAPNGPTTFLKLSPKQLDKPVKITSLTNLGQGQGLSGEKCDDGEFVMITNETEEFQEHFDLSKIPLDLDMWMEFFDKKAVSKDKSERGFTDGHFDLGYGREGVCMHTLASQEIDNSIVCAIPSLINYEKGKNDYLYKSLGPIIDLIQSFADKYVSDNGEILMSDDDERTRIFSKRLNEKMGADVSRFEAFTFVRQACGSVEEVSSGKGEYHGTSRHVDGPNDHRKGYRHTCVFSFYCIWNGMVYRISLICYTRASIGNWIERNEAAAVLMDALRDFRIERNGNRAYHDFSLADNMDDYDVFYSTNSKNNPHYIIRPDRKHVTEGFKERNPESIWHDYDNGPLNYKKKSKLEWVTYKLKVNKQNDEEDNKQKDEEDISIICLPENLNRYGYISAYASRIKEFIDSHNKPVYRRQVVQLVYVAIMSRSPILFWFLVGKLMEEKTDLVHANSKDDISLIRKMINLAKYHDLQLLGGPYGRYQSQGNANLKFFEEGQLQDKIIESNLKLLEECISLLDKGKFLNDSGDFSANYKTKVMEIEQIGNVCFLNFATMCVFTGLAVSEDAIATAKLAEVTTNSPYFPRLKKYMQNQDANFLFHKQKFNKCLKAIATAWDETIGTIENGCCATFRKNPKFDVFFKGETLFNLTSNDGGVRMKKYGNHIWMDAPKFPEYSIGQN